MRREKRERLARKVKTAGDKADAAIEEINGNPSMTEAVACLRDYCDAVAEALNLDIDVGGEA